MESFSERLRREIAQRFPSQRAFADRVGWAPEYLSRVLNQRDYRPEHETIVRLAEALGLSPREVAEWTGLPVNVALDDPADGFDRYEGDFVGWLRTQPRMRDELEEVRQSRGEKVYRDYLRTLWSAWESNFRATMAALRLGEGGDVT
jgi:transcriptional regulator with XRE-family HTH domain